MGEINWGNKCWVTTIYLVNSNKEVLLTWNKNLQNWIPIGGHIEPGETAEDAIIREVAEETGFDFEFLNKSEIETEGRVRVLKPLRIQTEEVPHHNHHMNIVFIGRCAKYSKDVTKTDEEEKLKWFSLSDLENEKSTILENVYKNSIEAIKLTSENVKEEKEESLKQYQKLCKLTAKKFETSEKEILTWGLGIAGEAGDVAGCIKKTFAHDNDQREGIKENIGDTMWYAAMICNFFGWNMQEILDANIEKLKKRYLGGGFTTNLARREGTRVDWNN